MPESSSTTVMDGLYPIRTVSSLTGINPVTLRAWERRYHLIQPQRTPKGHRLYTQADIDRIRKIVDLLGQGMSIGQVAPLLSQSSDKQNAAVPTGSQQVWQTYQLNLLDAVRQFNERALDNIYNDALSLYPLDIVNRQLIRPVLAQLGKTWKQRETGIAEEHFFSVYLRNKLGTRIHHLNLRNTGPWLLTSCLSGEQHELGLLFFVLAAVNNGYRVVTLGANTPLDQLPAVLESRPCVAVVLSGSSKPGSKVFDEGLPALVRASTVPVFVGGGICERHADDIEASGAISVGYQLQAALDQIGQTLGSST